MAQVSHTVAQFCPGIFFFLIFFSGFLKKKKENKKAAAVPADSSRISLDVRQWDDATPQSGGHPSDRRKEDRGHI